MAVILVTYDLKAPGRNYQPVYDYLKKFTNCKGLESVWLLDTTKTPAQIRDDLEELVDGNDVVFVVKLQQNWASLRYSCTKWLKDSVRSW